MCRTAVFVHCISDPSLRLGCRCPWTSSFIHSFRPPVLPPGSGADRTPRNPARKTDFRPGGTIDKHRAVSPCTGPSEPSCMPRDPPRSKTNPSVISGNLALLCRGGCGGRQAKSIFKIRKLGFPLLRGEEGIQRCSYRRLPGPPPGSRGQTTLPEIRPGCGSSSTLKQEGRGLKPDPLPPLI